MNNPGGFKGHSLIVFNIQILLDNMNGFSFFVWKKLLNSFPTNERQIYSILLYMFNYYNIIIIDANFSSLNMYRFGFTVFCFRA